MIDFRSNIDIMSILERGRAQSLLRGIVGRDRSSISFSRHARERMVERDLWVNDIVNVLCAGNIRENPEFKKGHWRYRVETKKIAVLIAFRSMSCVTVITAWRK